MIDDPSAASAALHRSVGAVLVDAWGLPVIVDAESAVSGRDARAADLPIEVGNQRHRVRLRADPDAARCLYQAITGSAAPAPTAAECRDAIAETLNVVVGRLAGLIERSGVAVSIGTPEEATPSGNTARCLASFHARLGTAAIELEWLAT